MRMLKKIGTAGPAFPWTQVLADRGDMVEVSDAPAVPEALKGGDGAGDPVPPAGDPEPESEADVDPLTITDKDELKRLLAERGVKLPGNPSLTTLQAKLAEALKGGDGAGD